MFRLQQQLLRVPWLWLRRRIVAGWAKHKHFNRLQWAAHHTDKRIRLETAYYLGAVPHKDAVPILREMLQDDDLDVVFETCLAFDAYHLPIELGHTVAMIKIKLAIGGQPDSAFNYILTFQFVYLRSAIILYFPFQILPFRTCQQSALFNAPATKKKKKKL